MEWHKFSPALLRPGIDPDPRREFIADVEKIIFDWLNEEDSNLAMLRLELAYQRHIIGKRK